MTNADELTLRNKINYKIETLEEELFQIQHSVGMSLFINKETAIRIKQIEYALTVLKMLIPEEWIKDDKCREIQFNRRTIR